MDCVGDGEILVLLVGFATDEEDANADEDEDDNNAAASTNAINGFGVAILMLVVEEEAAMLCGMVRFEAQSKMCYRP
eukprot:CAMPEP_0113520410 /NCGR_PEP_ID=MMETSP0014_2-20120614/44061_1 /TAXON_ID=2857 /ORGANISM="Nitzschia sp." /LENGTH=76 /DNA_ID=CAMNT_0000418239 /DNA_START=41 /DNA_END=271 /DNA_ORIENTATION=- /assembly_acc=CAM_ASM_000159